MLIAGRSEFQSLTYAFRYLFLSFQPYKVSGEPEYLLPLLLFFRTLSR